MDTLKFISGIGLLIYFAVLLAIVIFEKKNKNVEEFFFANRKLPFWVLSITFIASWWGAGSAIETANMAFGDGLSAFWYYGVPVLISTFLMVLGAKAIRAVGYFTQGEMLNMRYNQLASKLLSLMILIFMTMTAASQMVGIGDILGTYFEIKYEYAVLAGTAVVLIYSVFGGFRGVVLTDVIQFILLLISAIAIFWVAMEIAGGFAGIKEAAEQKELEHFTSPLHGAHKYLAFVITFGCSWMIQANVWQRISATKSIDDAKKMATMSFFAFIPLYLIVVFTGMACMVIFDKLPEGGVVINLVTDYMHPLLGAIVFVGISAAIMSTMDSVINTGAMTVILDLLPKNTDNKLGLSKLATLAVSAVALIIALKVRSILDVSWLASDFITNGAFVPLILGFIWRRGNTMGALASMIFGLSFSFYNLLIFLGVNLKSFWEQQSPEQLIIGVGVSLILYVTVSLFTKPEYAKADAFIQKSRGK